VRWPEEEVLSCPAFVSSLSEGQKGNTEYLKEILWLTVDLYFNKKKKLSLKDVTWNNKLISDLEVKRQLKFQGKNKQSKEY
jgi:hypothetical protein